MNRPCLHAQRCLQTCKDGNAEQRVSSLIPLRIRACPGAGTSLPAHSPELAEHLQCPQPQPHEIVDIFPEARTSAHLPYSPSTEPQEQMLIGAAKDGGASTQ